MIRRILLGIGGTPFTPVAIRGAIDSARRVGGSLTAVSVVDENRLANVGSVPLGAGAVASGLREHRLAVVREQIEEALEEVKAQCAQQGVPLTILRERGNPFQLMMDHGRYHDLTVFGLRSMFEYDLLGDDDVEPATFLRQLIEAGVTPLVAVADRFVEIRRVLIAYSGSTSSAESMAQFVRYRLWPEAAMRILVCEHPQAQAEALLNDALIYCRAHDFEPDVKYRPEPAKEAILAEAAQWHADMLVIGSSARSWLSSIFRETTMLHVIRHAECPLFVGD